MKYHSCDCESSLEFAARTDIDVVPFDLHFIAAHTIAAAVSRVAVANVKGEVMPRTEDHTSLAPAFCKRSTFVWAYIVDGVKKTVDVKHRNGLLVDSYNLNLTRRYIVYAGHACKTIHQYVFLLNGKRFLHSEGEFQFHSGDDMFLSDEARRRLDDVSRVFRRWPIGRAWILFTRLGIGYDMYDMSTFVRPNYINGDFKSLRSHQMTVRSLEDIQHPGV